MCSHHREFGMNPSYDPATDSLYIHLVDRASVDSVELTDGLVVDYDLDGAAVGIDMRRVSQATGLKGEEVRCNYLENEGTLQIRLTDKPVARNITKLAYQHQLCGRRLDC